MHAPSRAQYPLIDWMHGMRRFLLMKQNPEEQLSDYYKRFTQEYDTFKAQFGSKIFDEASERLSEYATATTAADKSVLKQSMFDTFASLLLLRGSDQNKYGSLLQTMTTSFSLGTDNYPRTKEKLWTHCPTISLTQSIIPFKSV
jgi:hypothetical protein